jgi:glutaminase
LVDPRYLASAKMPAVDLDQLLARITREIEPQIGSGAVADYIPALAQVDADQFGIAVALPDGSVHGAGDWTKPFSLQSISKLFTLALALAENGGSSIWTRVGREPSGNAFNSLVQLEYENGIPRNPFINAGALVVTDHLAGVVGDAAGAVLDFLRTEAGNPMIDCDDEVAASEAAHADRNLSLAHFLASYGNIRGDVRQVVDQYVRQCAIAISCRDLALAGLFLARHGTRRDGSRMLSPGHTKRINAVMLTCGTYDAAGEFAYRVGLPGKSGVGGGILAVVPGRCSVAVWGPGLDRRGNSVAGVAALDRFTTLTDWSVF